MESAQLAMINQPEASPSEADPPIKKKSGGQPNDSWDDDKLCEMIDLFNKGWSTVSLANHYGCTKNSICGYINRLRIGKRKIEGLWIKPIEKHRPVPTETRVKISKAKANANALKRARLVVAVTEEAKVKEPRVRLRLITDDMQVTLEDLRDSMCKYPIGDPLLPDFRFCGAPQAAGTPYCLSHARISYIPASERRRPRPRY